MLDEAVENKLNVYIAEGTPPEMWNLQGLSEDLLRSFLLNVSFEEGDKEELHADDIRNKVMKLVDQLFALKCEQLGEERRNFLMQHVMMRVIDESWREHLYMLDHLKSGINFRAYGQKDPLIEYKREAFDAFVVLLEKIKDDVASLFFKAQFLDQEEIERREKQRQRPEQMAVHHATVSAFSGAEEAAPTPQQPSRQQTVRHDTPKVGRNDACPCGSGKKYKHCHGRNG
jgi:preprotein translocase subunit SecA